ncbi:MAG: hypothetical protein LAD29_02970 [Rhodoferax sp.]|nr:hypothetical protein [Rhodoferax sp.]
MQKYCTHLWSFTRQFLGMVSGKPAPDAFQVRPCLFSILSDARECWTPPSPDLMATTALATSLRMP